MPTVAFTHTLQRHVEQPPRVVAGATVCEALGAVFEKNPKLRGYILEEDGAVRKHIAIWVAGLPLRDREALSDPVGEGDEIYVMQALSGG
ncbi:MAG: MoaD/ThiS family protein [Phycisphaerales bacterium JB063]